MKNPLPTNLRSHSAATVSAKDVGQTVTLAGWVHSRRDHGGLYFFDLRDRSGLVQVVVHPDNAEAFKLAGELGAEYVVKIVGKVEKRPAGTENTKIPTGQIEVHAQTLKVLNTSKTLPFEIDEAARQVWLDCFDKTLENAEAKYNFPKEHLEGFKSFLRDFSAWMVNQK